MRNLSKLIMATLILLTHNALAQTRYPYYPGYGYPYSPQQRQQVPAQRPPGNRTEKTQRGYPYPQWQPSTAPSGRHSQPQASSKTKAPIVQTRISNATPYVQQNLVLTLQVLSEQNFTRLTPKLPVLDGLAMKLLDGPATHSSNEAGMSITNEYHFSITPLRAGRLAIPPLTLTGTLAGRSIELSSQENLRLDVKPANERVSPWLPLNGLILQAYMEDADKPVAGKPIGLVIDISAIGITGPQLPSLEKQLQGRDFRVYRESTETKGRLSPDGALLMGSRSEHYTLVPQHGGRLQLPELNLSWWNVDTHKAEVATIPIRQLVAKGPDETPDDPITDLFPGASKLLLWLPIIGMMILTIGFWILAWLRKKRFIQVVEEELVIIATFTITQIQNFLTWLSPIRRLQKLRQIFVRNLPRSFRLWFCVKVVESETDPEVWSYMLKFLANKHLGLSPHLSLLKLGDALAAIHGADPLSMRTLMKELDATVYGRERVDFADWKRRFRQQLRPRSFRGGQRQRRPGRAHLPPLNPNT